MDALTGPNTQIKQERVQMDMSNDFFAKRLAAIEEARARRLPVIEPEETAQTRVDQLNRVIRLMVDCVTKMRLTGPPDKEIAVLLRSAADELDQ
jgi:hypothetical protein